jgi:hypothetical protein
MRKMTWREWLDVVWLLLKLELLVLAGGLVVLGALAGLTALLRYLPWRWL